MEGDDMKDAVTMKAKTETDAKINTLPLIQTISLLTI